jgi:3-hydroxybutyryl-CoA dehydrogenase
MSDQLTVSVIGAGTMGRGIAQVSAMAGNDVVIRDIDDDLIQQGLDAIESNLQGGVERGKVDDDEKVATLDRISGMTSLESAVANADLVIEAIPEQMALKKETFEQVDEHAQANAILATNTSSLSVTELASTLNDPGRMLGLHFFKPAHIMPIVEIIRADQTRDDTYDVGEAYVDSTGKTAVTIEDYPGFASSRLGAMLSNEALRMLRKASPPLRTSTRRCGSGITIRWVRSRQSTTPASTSTWRSWSTCARNSASGSNRRRS